jgi:hypothetical protein
MKKFIKWTITLVVIALVLFGGFSIIKFNLINFDSVIKTENNYQNITNIYITSTKSSTCIEKYTINLDVAGQVYLTQGMNFIVNNQRLYIPDFKSNITFRLGWCLCDRSTNRLEFCSFLPQYIQNEVSRSNYTTSNYTFSKCDFKNLQPVFQND